MFFVKNDYADYIYDLNEIRLWLVLEIMFFFNWIVVSAIFVMWAYIVKFKSISKNEALNALDDNVWNDKDRDDFLRYLKFEYFNLCYFLAFIATELIMLRSNWYGLGEYGERDFKSTGIILCVCLFSRFISFAKITMLLRVKPSEEGSKDNYEEPSGKTHGQSTVVNLVLKTVLFLAPAILYLRHDKLDAQNPMSKIWIQIEIVAMFLEIPYSAAIQWFLNKMVNQIFEGCVAPKATSQNVVKEKLETAINEIHDRARSGSVYQDSRD